MADLLRVSDKSIVISANTVDPKYATGYVIIPREVALALQRVPTKYITMVNGPREMTIQEKAAYDAAHPAPVIDPRKARKSKQQIINSIWASFTPVTGDIVIPPMPGPDSLLSGTVIHADTEEVIVEKLARRDRVLAAINMNALWLEFLNDADPSYDAAREYMRGVLASGAITSGDYNIIDNILPLT